MIKGTLIMALDFAARKGVVNETVSYRRNDVWYVVRRGPKHSNTFRVTEFDEAGEKQLLAWEQAKTPALSPTAKEASK